jgi:hypothetical protein
MKQTTAPAGSAEIGCAPQPAKLRGALETGHDHISPRD